MTATSEPILAYRASDPIEARALAAHLAQAGVEAQVLGEFLQGAYAGVHGLNAAEVWVSSADRAEAESILAQWRGPQLAASPATSPQPSDGAPTSLPEKIQFSTAAMLWLTTVVALLAAATSLDLIEFAHWPLWLINLLMLQFLLQRIIRRIRKLRHSAERCLRDVPSPNEKLGRQEKVK